MTARGAAILDRDGTLNVKAPEGDYVTTPHRLVLLPGAAAAVRRLNAAGVPVLVVTNQRGVALGRMTAADLHAVHARMHRLLAAEGAWVDGVFACPHERGACGCRKPLPGLVEQARAGCAFDPAHSVVVGDAESDVALGRAVGAWTVRLAPAGTPTAADLTVPDLAAAVSAVLQRLTGSAAA